jgi:uncharacterized membrane protein YhhN
MTAAAWTFLAIAAVFAVGDWIAVGRQNKRLEYLCKPAATAALVVVAATLHAANDDRQAWFVAALVLCLIGDVFLMLPNDRLEPGLVAFLFAHVAFWVGFLLEEADFGTLQLVACAFVAVAIVVLAFRFITALRRRGDRELVVPVIIYMVAIATMVVSAIRSGNGWGIVGAGLFVVSDSLIAETRFVAPRRGGPIAIMVTYHVALVGLAFSLLTCLRL